MKNYPSFPFFLLYPGVSAYLQINVPKLLLFHRYLYKVGDHLVNTFNHGHFEMLSHVSVFLSECKILHFSDLIVRHLSSHVITVTNDVTKTNSKGGKLLF